MSELLKTIKALSDETRLTLFKLLLTSDCCVGALSKHLGVTEANVSQHLQVLRKAGLVKGEKRGYWTHYTVVVDRLNWLAEEIKGLAELEDVSKLNCPKAAVEDENFEMAAGCEKCRDGVPLKKNMAEKQVKT